MKLVWVVFHLVALLVLPIVVVGVINRTKALWSGRKGPPIAQSFFDLVRLLSKRPVYSTVTTPIFSVAPYVLFGTALVTGLIVPLLGGEAPLSFAFDFVFFAYAWGLGRVALVLGALDTGSSFEGMGASREATYSAFVEPVLFLVVGTLAAATGKTSFAEILHLRVQDLSALIVWGGCIVAMFVLLQVESARIPVDDPNTHLELTMIHEVMVLDHGGPDFAFILYGAALKLWVLGALLTALVLPADTGSDALDLVIALAGMFALAVLVGLIESTMARLRLLRVPQLLVGATALSGLALVLEFGGL